MPRWRTFEERFDSAIERTDGCWMWRAGKIRGYGYIEHEGRKVMAHRVMYERHFGNIPVGQQVDHICMKRSCVNPGHLRLATTKQNCEHKILSAKNTSGYRGVTRHRDGVRWIAQVKHEQRSYYIGIFETAESAGEAARLKRIELFTHNDADRASTGTKVWPES